MKSKKVSRESCWYFHSFLPVGSRYTPLHAKGGGASRRLPWKVEVVGICCLEALTEALFQCTVNVSALQCLFKTVCYTRLNFKIWLYVILIFVRENEVSSDLHMTLLKKSDLQLKQFYLKNIYILQPAT